MYLQILRSSENRSVFADETFVYHKRVDKHNDSIWLRNEESFWKLCIAHQKPEEPFSFLFGDNL
jgi:hypothetical protein